MGSATTVDVALRTLGAAATWTDGAALPSLAAFTAATARDAAVAREASEVCDPRDELDRSCRLRRCIGREAGRVRCLVRRPRERERDCRVLMRLHGMRTDGPHAHAHVHEDPHQTRAQGSSRNGPEPKWLEPTWLRIILY